MVGLGVVEGSWGGWWLGVVGVGGGTTFALPKNVSTDKLAFWLDNIIGF